MKIYPPKKNPILSAQLLDLIYTALAPRIDRTRDLNHSAVARILGISRPTVLKWLNEMDTQNLLTVSNPWQNEIFLSVLRYLLPQIKPDRRKYINHSLRQLLEVHDAPSIIPIIREQEADYYLQKTLSLGPQSTTYIFATANKGQLKDKAIRRAAKRLGVIKKREGFGKKQKIFWMMPYHEANFEEQFTIDQQISVTPQQLNRDFTFKPITEARKLTKEERKLRKAKRDELKKPQPKVKGADMMKTAQRAFDKRAKRRQSSDDTPIDPVSFRKLSRAEKLKLIKG